ncbi:MAG: hypothetical protein ACXW0F_08020 [Gaiellaceae bacterium]
MSEALESAARLCEEVAAELDLAAQHCRTAARHFRDGEVPRAERMPGPRTDTSSKQTSA